ncbi:MAG: protein kinase, partial [Anaerolineae bacterium]|nr:protein kinase [Anaerolineae bacterium]
LRQLNHPNIVKTYGAYQESDNHYLVMEYVAGGSLYDLLRTEKRLPIKRAINIALELSDALVRAHHLGIIHRDIKPGNVLIADDGTPRLTDFGVAYITAKERVTDSGIAVGTLDYFSPEVLNGETHDARSDLWAFGVLLYEMCMGERPFGGHTIGQTVNNILNMPLPDIEQLRPDMPLSLIDLIYRLLQKDRNARIATARQLGAELEAILSGDIHPPALFSTPISSTHQDEIRHNLPVQNTPFVGRETEIAELTRLLQDPKHRLLTILAPGGMGKTRLALEVAGQFTQSQSSTSKRNVIPFTGVYVIQLAPLTHADTVPSAIAEALSLTFAADGRSQTQQLCDFLREKSVLLVLDNFEHLLDATALVEDMLQSAPNIKIVTTSRERLNLQAEMLFNLSGMDFPDWETPEDALMYTAVKLFMQSANRARPDFELLADDLNYVARICRLTYGLPLAIILAAAWVELLSLKEIADEIAKSLDFLESDMRDLPDRHKSMRAVFDYSWNLMNDAERDSFIRLSVFRGKFDRSAAQAVSDAGLRTLMGLVNKSLLHRDHEGNYEIHELLRQYAEERLKANPDQDLITRNKHSQHYLAVLASLSTPIISQKQAQACNQIEAYLENIRLAWRHAVAVKDLHGIGKAEKSLYVFYRLRSLNDERADMFTQAIQMVELLPQNHNQQVILGRLMSRYSEVLMRTSNVLEVVPAFQRTAELQQQTDDSIGLAFTLSHWMLAANSASQFDEAQRLSHEAVTLAESTGDTESRAIAYLGSAFVYGSKKPTQFYEYAQKALSLFDQLGQPEGLADSHRTLGVAARIRGEFDVCTSHLEKCLAYAREINDQFGVYASYTDLGMNGIASGHYDQAETYLLKALQIGKDVGVSWSISQTQVQLGDLYFAQERLEDSLAILTQSIESVSP